MTDLPYESALEQAKLETLKYRRATLSKSFNQILLPNSCLPNSCLHDLLPENRNPNITSKLHRPNDFAVSAPKTEQFTNSSI